jgi:hypothetical protein
MESASHSATLSSTREAAAPKPQLSTHDRRIALIGSISGSRLLRLRHMIRHEYRSRNGDRSCAKLRGGSVDCTCDYCTFFWSRLEERLR